MNVLAPVEVGNRDCGSRALISKGGRERKRRGDFKDLRTIATELSHIEPMIRSFLMCKTPGYS